MTGAGAGAGVALPPVDRGGAADGDDGTVGEGDAPPVLDPGEDGVVAAGAVVVVAEPPSPEAPTGPVSEGTVSGGVPTVAPDSSACLASPPQAASARDTRMMPSDATVDARRRTARAAAQPPPMGAMRRPQSGQSLRSLGVS